MIIVLQNPSQANKPSGKIAASINNDILTLDYQEDQNGIVGN